MNTTEWRPIPGYEGLYEVSDAGQVQRLAGYRCRQTRILHPLLKGRDKKWLFVPLCKNAVIWQVGVHQLVALAFLGKPAARVIHHKNGNWQDNRIDNLEYMSFGDAVAAAYASGAQPSRKGENNANVKLRDWQVFLARRLYRDGKTINELAERFCVSRTTMRNALRFDSWTHLGLYREAL